MVCKSKTSTSSISLPFCFILTMWYVNLANTLVVRRVFNSFILTMWYVNLHGSHLVVIGDVGFILTMWYVNIKVF